MVVAKSERAYTVLKRAFKERTVEKIYHALVQGHPDPSRGTVDAPIDRHPTRGLEVGRRRRRQAQRHALRHARGVPRGEPARDPPGDRPDPPDPGAHGRAAAPVRRRPDLRRGPDAGRAARPRRGSGCTRCGWASSTRRRASGWSSAASTPTTWRPRSSGCAPSRERPTPAGSSAWPATRPSGRRRTACDSTSSSPSSRCPPTWSSTTSTTRRTTSSPSTTGARSAPAGWWWSGRASPMPTRRSARWRTSDGSRSAPRRGGRPSASGWSPRSRCGRRERGLRVVALSAQTHALGFYERLGYAAHGPVFDDAGLPHRWMTKVLTAS